MANDADETLRRYLETVLRLRQDREVEQLNQDDLRRIAIDAGMTEEDMAYVEQRSLDHINRGEGFIRYGNWDGAIEELEQAIVIVPNNIAVLNALATAYWNRSKLQDDLADRRSAQRHAAKVLGIDSRNDTALRLLSSIQGNKEDGDVTIQTLANRSAVTRRGIGILFIAVIMVAAIGFGVAMMFMINDGDNQPAIVEEQPEALTPTPETPEPPPGKKDVPDTGFARLAQEFGSEGIGPGMFTDARTIAVGGDKIYVGEYSSGRIQVFDSAGTYLTQWNIGKNHYIKGMAADRNGTVFIPHSGRLFKYDGATGEPKGELQYNKAAGCNDVAMTPDGGVLTAWDGNWRGGIMVNPTGKDDIIRFDRNGKMVRTIRNAVSSASDGFEMQVHVAIDGLDNIYALGTHQNSVFKFSPEGKFLTRFGGSGHSPGKFSNPDAIAVDGRGRIYVADFSSVQVFDSEGTYLGVIDVRGAASGIAFNNRGELLVVARTRVLRYVIRG